ncbi:hypothetical protein ACE7GA_25570 [Roseomonas sp. CCTCC AB2023176]|uniref:hypothetical protein n=1 Tax=Roseomonas sp. CCTCC AB2023176 TaxID=3342640 RepID=UPI0035DFF732
MARLDRHHSPAPFAGTPAGPTRPPTVHALRGRASASGLSWRLTLLVALSVTAVATLVAGAGNGLADDPDLATLLRVTSITKGVIALGAATIVEWRLRHPIGWPKAAAAITAAALALAGPLVMFGLAHFQAGAALHYAGLGSLGLLAWLDRKPIAALLAAAAEDRRRRSRPL